MILELYITFVALALVTLGLGFWLGERYFFFVGLFFIFLCANSLLFAGVDYRSGETALTNYTYDNNTLSSTTEVISYNYSTFKNDTFTRWFGLFLALASGLGLGALMMQIRKDSVIADSRKRGEGDAWDQRELL